MDGTYEEQIRLDLALIRAAEDDHEECLVLPERYQDQQGRILVHRSRRQYRYHRWLFKRARRPTLRNGDYLRRTCDTDGCLNVYHYKVITQEKRVRQRTAGPRKPGSGLHVAAKNLAKTTCSRNHEYTDENTYYEKLRNGSVRRHCRTCMAERRAARAAKPGEST